MATSLWVVAVVAYFPPVDLRGWAGPNERFPALDFEPAAAEDLSPILYATAGDPPTLLLHGDEGALVPLSHSERMDAALDDVGSESELVIFPGAGHGFESADARRGIKRTASVQGRQRWPAHTDRGIIGFRSSHPDKL